jgi:hypothetical protein
MKLLFVQRQIGCCLAVLLAMPASAVYAAQVQQTAAQPQVPTSSDSQQPAAQLATRPQEGQDQGTSNAAAGADQNRAPVGTAAAPYEKASGVSATRPAGAVIAPAKQRRVRQIFIKVGILVGAGAAIAAVAMLSHSSPSTPH